VAVGPDGRVWQAAFAPAWKAPPHGPWEWVQDLLPGR
jgi:hypothetical protein